MEFVERILSKVVGEEIAGEELELVSGGMARADCETMGGHWSYMSESQRICDE